MIGLLITLLIVLILLSLVWWILTQLPLPGPIKQIATVVVVVIAVIILVSMLLPYSGAEWGRIR